ncbi:hypothetical protein SAMN05192532_10869 [Alteribacillus iranensis]|uniref:Uncharacterized protein n=1 Tax=Alteribacillus iranensis TaxID=930128 RepID=A0A1I2F279_9BACI|nr:hypothetical protein SAMN05192532_10869 [Alteribacillus iranensis]
MRKLDDYEAELIKSIIHDEESVIELDGKNII